MKIMIKQRTVRISLILLGLLGILGSCNKDVPFRTLSLENLSSFEEQPGNWLIVGEVEMDSSINIYKENPQYEGKVDLQKMLNYIPGTGILLNKNDKQRGDLLSKWEHGDLDLKAEVMLARGSNSGIYLQGRYEVQLFDSWGISNPTFADIGGIYENWEEDPRRAFGGSEPLVNAAKAPGVWQTIEISFRSPRFDKDGKKIKNACFKSVKINGIEVQKDAEVPWPTGGPIENNEVDKGPLRLQGDHGIVAFRNIKYRLIN